MHLSLPSRFISLGALLCVVCAACSSAPKRAQPELEVVAPSRAAFDSGIDTAGMDRSVKPADDLYRYVNGTWLNETELPADRSNYGAFAILADRVEEQLRAIVDGLKTQQGIERGSAAQKIRDHYASYIEATERAEVELGDLGERELKRIDAIKSADEFWAVSGALNRTGVDLPLGLGVLSDFKESGVMAVYIGQGGGLTLPDRDYYLEDDEPYLQGRALYKTYADHLLELAGYTAPAGELLAFETELAKISWTREAKRDLTTQYNPRDLAGLKELAPRIDWEAYLRETGALGRERYVVMQLSFVEALGELVSATDLATLKAYLRLKVLSRYAPVLGRPAFEAAFAFEQRGLSGVAEPRAPWKRALETMHGAMGELLGKLYVDEHFEASSKRRMESMIERLTEAYRASIESNDWMSEETKRSALSKLATFHPKIAYPDRWRDHDALAIGADAVANRRAIAAFEFERDLAKLDRPVDKTEWMMPPHQVNAYYNPLWNEIVFPAAILQPPFFDPKADDAVNYGAIGAVIGHEIGHGFDDQGRKFDAEGNMRDWWTKADAIAFDQKKDALAAQYDAFKVIGDKTINGAFTSGENIGDLAGLSIAHKAYRASLEGADAPVIDGLTGDQRFFMGWAQVWRRLYTDAELERRLVTDPHSPSEARVNVVVRNIPAFHEAFGVKPGDAMWLAPEERVSIW